MKVSVIIPIYNTGLYLRNCIGSICNQTYRDLQIIMIDDGSIPETAMICDQISATDSRIQVIHKHNEGVSIARNVGLSLVRGEITCFVDSDDTISPDMINNLVDALCKEHAQIAMCDAVTIRPGKPDETDTIPDYDQSCVIDTDNISAGTLTRLAGSACRCAYRTETLLAAQASFPEGLKFSEDRIFNIIAMSKAKRIAYIKQPLYNRLIRSGSACFRYYPDMTEQIEKMRDVLIPTVKKCWGTQYVNAYERQIEGHILFAITNYTSFRTGETFNTRFLRIKNLCANKSIRECLKAAGIQDLRSKAVLKNNHSLVYLLGCFINIYHKLCKRGQYQA